jgi:hypothetical protein
MRTDRENVCELVDRFFLSLRRLTKQEKEACRSNIMARIKCKTVSRASDALVVYTSSNPHGPLGEPMAADLRQVKRGRKSKTYVAGISFGVLLLVLLGPIGGVAAGISGAFAAKSALARREKKVIDRMVHGGHEVSTRLQRECRLCVRADIQQFPLRYHPVTLTCASNGPHESRISGSLERAWCGGASVKYSSHESEGLRRARLDRRVPCDSSRSAATL